MTYQEIKDRLSRCELTLEKLKNGNSTSKDVKIKTEKLNLLRESYLKLLKEADKGIIYTDDEKKAKDLADDGSNVKLTKEQEGVKFSVDETKAIAKKVGKAVAMSLKAVGDSVTSMKAKNIEENSFDIQVNYKGEGPEDTFSFYITDDTLHLTDFSFDKELTDVGVKPSGEALVNVDVVANELLKHFKSMNEKVDEKDKPELKKLSKALKNSVKAHQDQKKALDKAINTEGEVSEAPDNMYYIKVKKTDKASQNALQDAVETFHHPVKFADIVDDDGAGNVIFYIHEKDWDPGMEDDIMGNGVQIVDTNMPLSEDAEEDAKNDADYEAGWHDDPRQDEDKDKETDDYGRPYVDPKGSRTFLEPDEMLPHNRFKKMTQKEDTDVGHQDDEPDMLSASAMETAEYAAKLVKKLQKYDQHDGEVDFPNWWQKKLILAREYMSAAYHYLDSEEKQPAIDQLALEGSIKEGRGDLQTIIGIIEDRASDSGFSVEDEAEEVIEAIQDHYNLDMYGKQKGVEENVDKVAGGIPYKREGNKFIISEPLDDATKERIISKAKERGHHAAPNQAGGVTIMAKDNVNERLRFLSPEKQKTNDAKFEKRMALLKALEKGIELHKAGKISDEDLHNLKLKAGTINERLSGDARQAIYDLQDILDRAAQLGDEARQIVKDNFPNELSAGEAYDVFSFGTSSNSYDKTLETLISDIERTAEEEDLDEKKNIVFSDSAYDTVVRTMKRLAKKYKAGDKSVVKHLKKLTHIKKQLEKAKIAKAAMIGKDQELDMDEGRKDKDALYPDNPRLPEIKNLADKIISMVKAEAAKGELGYIRTMEEIRYQQEDDFERTPEWNKAKGIRADFDDYGSGTNEGRNVDEAGPGFKHDCAAKVVHEKYGKGNTIPEKHTLVKEGNKYVVTHYDVLFENGNTVLDIPVNELKIETTNEHWHKGYKKKKK